MNQMISCCGTDCSTCYCFGSLCQGCNESKGKVFHCGGRECSIYACSLTKNGYKNCSECKELPCDIWRSTRDPKFSDEEFAASIKERVERLVSLGKEE